MLQVLWLQQEPDRPALHGGAEFCLLLCGMQEENPELELQTVQKNQTRRWFSLYETYTEEEVLLLLGFKGRPPSLLHHLCNFWFNLCLFSGVLGNSHQNRLLFIF